MALKTDLKAPIGKSVKIGTQNAVLWIRMDPELFARPDQD
jgi:hypothetical protein